MHNPFHTWYSIKIIQIYFNITPFHWLTKLTATSSFLNTCNRIRFQSLHVSILQPYGKYTPFHELSRKLRHREAAIFHNSSACCCAIHMLLPYFQNILQNIYFEPLLYWSKQLTWFSGKKSSAKYLKIMLHNFPSSVFILHPSHTNVPFLYPLRMSENQGFSVFWHFQVV